MSYREIPVNRPALQALFKRAGGEKGLESILQDFYRRMASDVIIGFFFDGKDVPAIATRQKEFLMRAMGAASSYRGNAPADAHDKLAPVLPGHFDRRLRILEETLQSHGLGAEDIQVWIGFENAFRDAVVKKT